MARHSINNILKGIAPTYYFGEAGTYLGGCAIDPDIKVNGRIGGAITPSNYEMDSSSVNGVMWFETNDVDDNTYYYTKDGDFGYIDTSGNVSEISELSGSSGNGLAYYNNYYYIAKDTDIARYGPLDGSAVIEDNWWSAQDNLEKLNNKQYATVGEYQIPNHCLYVHPDSQLYVADYQGQGTIHRLKMIDRMEITGASGTFYVGEQVTGGTSSARATIFNVEDGVLSLAARIGEFEEGETINGTTDGEATVSNYQVGNQPILKEMNALTWSFEEYPVAMAALGTSILILSMKSSEGLNKGSAVMYLWDTFDIQGFYGAINLPYPVATAVKTYNGIPYIWGGDNEGYSLSRYIGGESLEPFLYIDNGNIPLQGAVAAQHNKILWGSSQTYPEDRGCVWSWSSRARFSGLHNIASAGNQVSAIRPQDLDGRLLISSDDGIYTAGGEYDSIWRSEMISFGRLFNINEIYIPIAASITGSDKITVTLYYDNETVTDVHEITSDTYSDNIIKISPKAEGVQNFFIEIKVEAENKIPIIMPISIDYDILS